MYPKNSGTGGSPVSTDGVAVESTLKIGYGRFSRHYSRCTIGKFPTVSSSLRPDAWT
ncbi:hypothetical protein BHM03_00016622 [Ensete ventricosum]|nr:hypothetical protein BHM03_00016622 [Ensete ventricosum]